MTGVNEDVDSPVLLVVELEDVAVAEDAAKACSSGSVDALLDVPSALEALLLPPEPPACIW